MSVFYVPSSQLVVVPQGLAAVAQQLVAETGALDSIDNDVPGAEAVSYDALDDVPELIGPLVDVRAEPQGPPIRMEDLRNPNFYGDVQGSGFETQRAFVQNLLCRKPPERRALQEFALECDAVEEVVLESAESMQDIKGEDIDSLSYQLGTLALLSNFDHEFLKIQAAAATFLRGLAFTRSEADSPENAYLLLTLAASKFARANLDGAAAISHRLGMLAASGYINTVLDNRYVINYLVSSAMSGRNATPLGGDYLYALYYSKRAEDFERMQGLLLYSGKVQEAQGMVEEAVRAYVASLWVFFNNKPVTVEMCDRAIAALGLVRVLMPQYEAQITELIERLVGASVVSNRTYYLDRAMDYERAARAQIRGEPELVKLFEMSARVHEKHDRLVEIARGERDEEV